VSAEVGVVEQARTALGSVGALLPWSPTYWAPAATQHLAVRRLEQAGYGAVWLNEVLGKDAFAQAALLLAATERLVLGTAIANIWARSPQTARGAAAQLSEAFPGRFVLGLGGGYPDQATSVGRQYGSPVTTMRDYLDTMAAPAQTTPPAKSWGPTSCSSSWPMLPQVTQRRWRRECGPIWPREPTTSWRCCPLGLTSPLGWRAWCSSRQHYTNETDRSWIPDWHPP